MKELLILISKDILKNRTIIAFAILLFCITWSVFILEDSNEKALHTLGNLVLMVVPLISILFSTIYIYNSTEFIELLVSQPLKRKSIWMSLFAGINVSMIFALFVSIFLPILFYSPTYLGFLIMLLAIFLSAVFISLGFLSSILFKDKARGIGFSMILWLFFALIFDGLILFFLFQFSDYPIEKPMTVIAALNPIDVSRILLLTEMDNEALMGYTGALFQKQFGSIYGKMIIVCILVLWVFIPYYFSLIKFSNKDI